MGEVVFEELSPLSRKTFVKTGENLDNYHRNPITNFFNKYLQDKEDGRNDGDWIAKIFKGVPIFLSLLVFLLVVFHLRLRAFNFYI